MRLPRSLFTRLTAAYAIVVVVAFGVAASLTIFTGRGALERLVVQDLNARAGDALEEIDRYLTERAQEVRSWSGLGVMDEVLIRDSALNIENLLLALRREHPGYYSRLTVLDRDEMVVASTDVTQIGRRGEFSQLSWRMSPGSELLRGDLPPDGMREDAIIALAHPIRSRLDPAPIGWLVAHASWAPITRIVADAEVGGHPQDAARLLLLIDDAGHLLAGNRSVLDEFPGALALVSAPFVEGVSTEEVEDAGPYLVARRGGVAGQSLLGSSARVIAYWRTDEAYDLMRLFVGAVVGSAVLGLTLAVGASFLIARGISARVRDLSLGTEALASGDLQYRVDDREDDELGHLARSLNEMAAKLSDAKDTLEAALARWRALVANAPDVILTVDRDGTILFINRSGPALPLEKGASIYACPRREYRKALRKTLETVFRTGEAGGLEIEGPAPSSGTAWYSCRIGPIRLEHEIVGATVIVTDVTEQKRLEREILDIDQQERERIGQDLHDSLGQVLTGISLLSKGLVRKLAESDPGARSESAQLLALSHRAIDQARGLARGLRPVTLEKLGLRAALEELAADVGSMLDVSCRVEGESPLPPLDASKSMHLFRIVQEAMNNALRHGEPRNIVISFSNGDDRNLLVVKDDGAGIPEPVPEDRGLGLRLMRYRAKVIGASLDIRRDPAGGTVVTCGFR